MRAWSGKASRAVTAAPTASPIRVEVAFHGVHRGGRIDDGEHAGRHREDAPALHRRVHLAPLRGGQQVGRADALVVGQRRTVGCTQLLARDGRDALLRGEPRSELLAGPAGDVERAGADGDATRPGVGLDEREVEDRGAGPGRRPGEGGVATPRDQEVLLGDRDEPLAADRDRVDGDGPASGPAAILAPNFCATGTRALCAAATSPPASAASANGASRVWAKAPLASGSSFTRRRDASASSQVAGARTGRAARQAHRRWRPARARAPCR